MDTLLARLAEIVPQGLRGVVIADRAFGNPTFTDRVEKRGWDWLVRIQRQTCFRDRQGRRWQASQILPRRGRWKGRGQVFKKQGWREASLVAFWDCRHQEPLFVASSLPPRWELIRLYLRRGAIECLFRELYRTVDEPVRWALGEFSASNWSQQVRNYHGHAYVFAHTQGCASSVVKVARTALQ